MDDHVVVTGTGLVSALGNTASETWDALIAGKSGIRRITDFEADGFDCRSAAQVSGLDAARLDIHPRDARIMDLHSFMLMKCAQDAYSHAGIGGDLHGEDIGLFAGMGMVDYKIDDLLPAVLKSTDADGKIDYDRFFSGAYQEIYPLWPLSMLNNISFCQVAIRLNIRGENAVFSPHADSGVEAISEAVEALKDTKTKAVLAGGVSEKISPSSIARAHLSGTLNTAGSDDETCRPFSAGRKGTIQGEGCGMIALERRSSADARGVPSRARVTGFGGSFEVSDNASAPTAGAVSHSMQTALAKSGRAAEEIDVIIAHGDGTPIGDRNEIEAIQSVFSGCLDTISVYSSKGALGNMYAGAPAVDTILGIHMIEEGKIPPTLNCEPQEEGIGFHLVSGSPLERKIKRVMVNCRSYEGQCGSLIIEKIE